MDYRTNSPAQRIERILKKNVIPNKLFTVLKSLPISNLPN